MRLLALLSVVIGCAYCSTVSSPLFLWTGSQSSIIAKASKSFAPLNSKQLEDHLVQILSNNDVTDHGGPLSPYIIDDVRPPKTMVFFVKSVLTSSQFSRLADVYAKTPSGGALHFLKSVLSKSSSSLTIPYSQVTSLLDTVVDPLAFSMFDSNDILCAGIPSNSQLVTTGTSVSMDKLLSTLNQRTANSDPPRLVVVYLHEDFVEDSQQDDLMKQVTEQINKATNGDYLAVYGGDNFVAQPRGQHQRQQRQQQQQQQSPPPVDPKDLAVSYFPRFVWAWLFLVLFLLILILWAISNLASLQVPPRLLDESRARSKKNK